MKTFLKLLSVFGITAMTAFLLPITASALPGHVYIGGQIGFGKSNAGDIIEQYTKTSVDYNVANLGQFRAFGGYDINGTYGFEVGYMRYTETDVTHSSTRYEWTSHAFDVLATARKHFERSNWEIYGKAGVAYVSSDLHISPAPAGANGKTDFDAEGFAPEVVGGGAYSFNRDWSLNIEYSHIFASANYGDPKDSSQGGIDMLSTGVAYKF